MQTAQNLIRGKNALWLEYKTVHPDVHDRIYEDLKAEGLDRHWHQVASKEGHDLPNAKGKLIKIFLTHMPETAPLFGVTLVNQ